MADTPSPSLAAIDEAIAASRSEARRALLQGLRAVVAAEVGALPDLAEAEALLVLPHAATAKETGTDDPTCACCGAPVDTSADLDADASAFAPGEDVCVPCAYTRMARLARGVRSLAARVRGLKAAHDAAIAGIVEGLREREVPVDPECDIIRVTGDEADGWGVTCCERHDLVGEHDSAHGVRTALDSLLPGLDWWEEDPGVWMARWSIFDDVADSIATLHSAALARHAAEVERVRGVEVERDELLATLANATLTPEVPRV